ncbi:MAG: hypothetical protein MJ166_08045 [Clostridia bacterium]|nr:hypothetical protein [Clostridia bacterium]
MASYGKKDFAKRDMNFFSEFTASSQAFARAAGWIVVFSIAVVAITVLFCIYKFVDYGIVNSKVETYDKKFATDEYKNLKIDAEELTAKAASTNQYSYVVQSMQSTVDKEEGVKFAIISSIEEHIPSNVILTGYDIDKGQVKITGEAHSYYAPTEMINMIKEDVEFTNDNLIITRVDPSELGDSESYAFNYVSAKYSFEFVGSLVSNSMVKVSYIGPDSMIIRDLQSEQYETGKVFVLSDIAKITYNNQTYTLTSILVNGKTVSPDELAAAQTGSASYENGVYKVYIAADTKIDLYYDVAVVEVAN